MLDVPFDYLDQLASETRARKARLYGRPMKTVEPQIPKVVIIPLPPTKEDLRAAQEAEQEAVDRAAYARLKAKFEPITLPARMHPSIAEIVASVAKYFQVSTIDILSDRRDIEIMRSRQIAYYISKQLTPHSFPTIGRGFYRDHTSVLSGVGKITKLLATDKVLVADVRAIMDSLVPPVVEVDVNQLVLPLVSAAE